MRYSSGKLVHDARHVAEVHCSSHELIGTGFQQIFNESAKSRAPQNGIRQFSEMMSVTSPCLGLVPWTHRILLGR